MIYFIGSRKRPFKGVDREAMYKNIVERLNKDSDDYFMKDFPSFYSDCLKNLIPYLLKFDPKQRPSF